MNLGLSEQVALVTGAASGSGLATAELFAAEGAAVVLCDRDPRVVEVAAGVAERTGLPAIGLPVDITDEAAVIRSVQSACEELGMIDHLVHAAAIGSGKFGFPFLNVAPSDWRRVLDVNILGTVNVAHALAPVMVERRRGTMLFIASVAGQIGSQTDPPYSASKAANINFAQCLAKDLAPHGIRVNALCPGMVKTPLNRGVWQAWHDQQPPDRRRSYEEWADEKVRTVVPLGRWQTPEDIANMAVFLASERAGHVTGQTINVDGGYVMHW